MKDGVALPIEAVIASVSDHTNDAVVITAAEPVQGTGPEIVWVNSAFTQMTGYLPDEVIGKTPRILQRDDIDPVQKENIRESLRRWLPVRATVKNYRKDGTPFWVDLSIKPVADASGWYQYWVSIQRDVTAEVAQARALKAALEESRAGDRAQSEFLATISHEMLTPLNGILGMTQLLPVLGEVNDAQKNAVETIWRSSQQLKTMIDNVLNLAEVRSGRSRLQRRVVNLRQLCQDAVSAVRATAEMKDLELFVSVSSKLPVEIVTDDRRALEVLVHLLANAVKFTSVGRITLRAKQEEDGRIVFAVSDTGPGIPDDKRETIFQQFKQADQGIKRQADGAGLGLSLAAEFATLLGGKLMVESEVGVGSTFTFALPAEVANLGAVFDDDQFRSNSRRRTVVILLENLLDRLIVEQAFRYDGWSTVTDLRPSLFIEKPPAADLILIDESDNDGYGGRQLLERLKAEDGDLSATPTIVLSSDARQSAMHGNGAHQSMIWFSKPIDAQEIVKVAAGFVKR